MIETILWGAASGAFNTAILAFVAKVPRKGRLVLYGTAIGAVSGVIVAAVGGSFTGGTRTVAVGRTEGPILGGMKTP